MKETLIHLSCFTTDIDANGTIENYDLLKSEENVEPSLITIISTLRWHVLRLMTYRAHLGILHSLSSSLSMIIIFIIIRAKNRLEYIFNEKHHP
jgi:hypothetical protein